MVVDANVAFKCLTAQRGDLRDRLSPSVNLQFYSPRFLIVELFKHKERLSRATCLSEEYLLQAFHTLIGRLEFVTEANILLGTWMEAHRLCKAVDEADTPYVALTLHLDGRLWTDDKELKAGLRANGFDYCLEP